MDNLDKILNEWKIDNSKYNNSLVYEKIKIKNNYRKKTRKAIFITVGLCVAVLIGSGFSFFSYNNHFNNVYSQTQNNYNLVSYNSPKSCVFDGSESDIICYTLLEE